MQMQSQIYMQTNSAEKSHWKVMTENGYLVTLITSVGAFCILQIIVSLLSPIQSGISRSYTQPMKFIKQKYTQYFFLHVKGLPGFQSRNLLSKVGYQSLNWNKNSPVSTLQLKFSLMNSISKPCQTFWTPTCKENLDKKNLCLHLVFCHYLENLF